MGNSRQMRAGRRAKVESQKEQIKRLTSQVGYQQGLNMALAAEMEAMRMERPADLEEWIESIVPEMNDEELADWNSMEEQERQDFIDRLGQRINVSKALLDAGAEAGPTPSASGS